ncbi:PTS system IIB component, Gat family [Thermanaeromonas toyohensis ToBE]|uniref:PTS system IIB component, Gat family n=1 Tax=Thermanaeromonas toyohensis ToBE TaxID=698762 RepID=A0A1W1VNR2_9FIRM|nr:PTS sugar transporter subunit IIB [Thermanaeromonas toyohensis]SMB94997.1 PTS system IIB component, Gat family [Thermanaeromonas toyohensis ToBE]
MVSKKRVLIVCGTGIATSTVVAEKVKEGLKKRGIEVDTIQAKVVEVPSYAKEVDLIVATTPINVSTPVPVIKGLAFLTGLGEETLLDQIAQALK